MKTHPRDSPTGGTPRARARDGGLARSGPFGGQPGPRAGLGARMELGLQWLEAWGFWRWGWLLSAVQNWCPSWVPGRVRLPREPSGGSGLPPPCRGCSDTPATGPWLSRSGRRDLDGTSLPMRVGAPTGVIIGHLPVTSLGTKCHQSKEPKHGGDFSWFHGTEDA